MRIDRYLHCIRLVKSRTLAQGASSRQVMSGSTASASQKSSEEVRVGSVVALPLHGQIRILKVARPCLSAGARPLKLVLCYEELGIDEPKLAT